MKKFFLIVILAIIYGWLRDTSDVWIPVVIGIVILIVGIIAIKLIRRYLQNRLDPEGSLKRKKLEAELAALRGMEEQAKKAQIERERLELTAYRSPAMTGQEFEHWCARRLDALGWETEPTKVSGDQGCDVIARKNGVTIVIQCKLHTKPVGNKAVQEVFAAKHHYNAYAAAVVSSSGFTKAAKELSISTKVFLFHADELSQVDRILNPKT